MSTPTLPEILERERQCLVTARAELRERLDETQAQLERSERRAAHALKDFNELAVAHRAALERIAELERALERENARANRCDQAFQTQLRRSAAYEAVIDGLMDDLVKARST